MAPYVDHADVNGGGPHTAPNATADINGGQDGRLHRARPSRDGRAASNPTDPACTNSATPDVMGYHTAERHPELLDLRQGLRPPGPHVRAERLVEPARAPLPGLGVVGLLHPAGQPVELRERAADQSSCEAARARPPSTAARPARRRHKKRQEQPEPPADLRLDRPDLPAAQGPRELGLLRRERDRARLRERRRRDLRAGRAELQHPGHLEPAAVVRHGEGRRPARQHPVRRPSSTPRPRPGRCRRCRGWCPRAR